jgi:hypothetical protein
MKAERRDTWAASIKDKPGALQAKLDALTDAGANLEFVIARREPGKRKAGVVFVTPLKGAAQCRAARKAGFDKTDSLHTIRVEGPDKKGQGSAITAALAGKGVNVRGLSAAAIGRKFVGHIALDSSADATQAIRALKAL